MCCTVKDKRQIQDNQDKAERTKVAERSKTRVYGRLLAGVAVSNAARGMDVCVVCFVQ